MATNVVRVGVTCLISSPVYPGYLFTKKLTTKGCVLIGKRLSRHGLGKLGLPGGHLELGESWEDCASREVLEETNLTIASPRLYQVTNDRCIDGNPLKHYITIFMTSSIADESQALVNMEPQLCEGWQWMSIKDLYLTLKNTPELVFEPLRNLLNSHDVSTHML